MIETPDGGEEEWWACPRRPVKDDPALFYSFSRSYALREKGFLPYAGTYMDQPNALIEGWEIIDKTIAEVQREEDKRREANPGR